MKKINEYKKNFIEVGNINDIPDMGNFDNNKQISVGSNIANMNVSLHKIIDDILSKTERPTLIICDDNIEYANKAFLKMMGFSDYSTIFNKPFLKFVSHDDWDFIAENIGNILIDGNSLEVRMLNTNYKTIRVTFDTLYIENDKHFCFALIAKSNDIKTPANTLLYDEKLGLPRFTLYEYSVQKAIDYEMYKDISITKNKVAVCAIAIKNYSTLKNDGQIDFILQRMAEKLLLSTNKLYTVATGSKFPFWILIPDMHSDIEIEQELLNIQNILNQPIRNQQFHHNISVAMGVSVYPNEAQSAKKIISQAEMAVSKAMKEKQSSIVYYGS